MKTKILLATLSLALTATAFAQSDDRPRRQRGNSDYTNQEARGDQDFVGPRARRFQGEFAPGQRRNRQGGDQIQERRRQRLHAQDGQCMCPNCPVGRRNMRQERAGMRDGEMPDRPRGPRWADRDDRPPQMARGNGPRARMGRGPDADDEMGPRGRRFGGPRGNRFNAPDNPGDRDNGPAPDDR